MAEEEFLRLDDQPDSEDHTVVEEISPETAPKPQIYYAYCKVEKRRISNDTFDRRVAQNTANNHARVYNHATAVYAK